MRCVEPTQSQRMVRLIGLMGPIASGKSAVTNSLLEQGVPVVDADAITHELQSDPQGQVHKKLVKEFGTDILGEGGKVDRQKLSAKVFNNPEQLRALNKVMHGAIMREIIWRTVSLMGQGHRKIFWDIPLLAVFLQKQPRIWRNILSGVVAVLVPPEVQLQRLMARNGFSEEEARKRIDLQMSAQQQRELATVVIENDGTLEELKDKVATFLRRDARGWSALEVTVAYVFIVLASVAAFFTYGAVAGAGALGGGLVVYRCVC